MKHIRSLILALALSAGLAPAFAQAPPPVPALPDAERRTSYVISASTCACNVNFQLYGDSTDFANWLKVYINGVEIPQSGNWNITSPSGSIAALPRPISNAVLTFTAAQTGTVQIVGAQRPRRLSEYSENRGVAARDLNQAINGIEAQLREMWDRQFRTVQAPPGETLNLLPVLASRASMGACFDSNGNLTSCVSVPSSTFAAGAGVTFTGTNPTTISTSTFTAGTGITLTGTNPTTIAFSLTNTICTLSPSSCLTFFGYANPVWYGAVCDGVTDDTAAFRSALVAANRKVLYFPAGATCIVQYLEICTEATCQTGRAGNSVPFMVEGNGAILKAPASVAGASTFVYVELNSSTQYASNIWNFAIRNLQIDANNQTNRGLTVVGCIYCLFENIGERQAQVIGCHFNAMPNYIIANTLVQRVHCNFNNTNSGVQGIGVFENTSATWLGASVCTTIYNAGNSFVSVHALFNGLFGWDVDCANNSHVNPDIEQNLSYGISFAHISASEWIGAQLSSNKNARGPPGTGGDASAINNDGSPGIQFFGGFSDGSFTQISGAFSNTLAMPGQAGFAYTANCNASGHYCMTLP